MNKKKILVVTGTRAEYGLLKSTMEEITASEKLDLRLLVTGMHTLSKYGNTVDDIRMDGFNIDCVVGIDEEDDMLAAFSKEIVGIKEYCKKNMPDLILVLGDRDEPFAAAIVAGHLKIPVAHIHGGDVTGYVVDEYIRHSITKFSHLHFTASRKSYERVINLGEESWRVFNVGAPGLDAVRNTELQSRDNLAAKFSLNINKKWFLIIQHPVQLDKITVEEQISATLRSLKDYDAEKIFIYPNSDNGSDTIIEALEKCKNLPGCYINKNFDRITYLSLLKNCDLMVGNSSSGIIEAGFFQRPVIDIGNRQSNRECGLNVIRTGHDVDKIKESIGRALSEEFKTACYGTGHPYGNGTAGKEIVKILEKHIDNPDLFYKKFTYA